MTQCAKCLIRFDTHRYIARKGEKQQRNIKAARVDIELAKKKTRVTSMPDEMTKRIAMN